MTEKAFLVVGMAGTGKTTFCQRLYSWLNTEVVLKDGLNSLICSINLDPAVNNPKMPLTYDIRDKVEYQEIKKKHSLGPNGAINMCLNIFLLNFIPPKDNKYMIIDTPGQIEAFTWSSPGDAICSFVENLCILYVIDIETCKSKYVFLTNMICAASLKSKFKRPLLIIFNKSDLCNSKMVENWIKDFESFRSDLSDEESELGSACLYFEEFYNNIDFVYVSSSTGEGKLEFMSKIEKIYEKTLEKKDL